jgi:hypothetical protein
MNKVRIKALEEEKKKKEIKKKRNKRFWNHRESLRR